MAGKQDGYEGRLDISTDGGATFVEVKGLDTLSYGIEKDLFEGKVLEDNGEARPEVNGSTRSISASGYRITSDPGQATVIQVNATKESQGHFRYYPNKFTTTEYIQFVGIVSSLSREHSAEDKTAFSFEVGIHGATLLPVGVF